MGVLGKRKHRGQKAAQRSNEEDEDHLAIFRRAFEAKFQPLESSTKTPGTKPDKAWNEVNEESDSSVWDGFESKEEDDKDDSADEQVIEVIEHSRDGQVEPPSKAQARAYMNSKPPDSSLKNRPAANPPEDDPEDDNEQINLKNDLALQRLISESHILDEKTDKGMSSGRRQKLLDMRVQALGSKSSMLQQRKMPMSHRKGIIAKASEREAKRRQEARDNGIVLEKAAKPRKLTKEKMRVRGVGGPAVGKFKGGTLQLSKKDVAEIRGPAARPKGNPKRKR